jgi:hypothetical protein
VEDLEALADSEGEEVEDCEGAEERLGDGLTSTGKFDLEGDAAGVDDSEGAGVEDTEGVLL